MFKIVKLQWHFILASNTDYSLIRLKLLSVFSWPYQFLAPGSSCCGTLFLAGHTNSGWINAGFL